ncbi:MAG TPA: phospholipase D-like domain-containing protein [Terriglobia bacterium]|nr:phospholipase D-like domain-containing protein [Terriglobia bacterium]
MKHRLGAPIVAIVLLTLVAPLRLDTRPSFSQPAPAADAGHAAIDGPYFSDRDQPGERVIAAINHARSTLDVAMFDLTHPDITAALDRARRRGVRVRLVADEGQARDRRSEVPYLRSKGIAVRLSGGFRGERSIMHDKFAVFDGQTVETGSFNWTSSAERYNFENLIFISSPAVADSYEAAFRRIWEQGKSGVKSRE